MMTHLRAKAAFVAIAFVALFAVVNQVQAEPKCTNKCEIGWEACNNWCYAHNKTAPSQAKCLIQCSHYWLSGKNPQSIGPADPSNAPSGPAQVNPPPKSSQ
jgi:hypothetical protein